MSTIPPSATSLRRISPWPFIIVGLLSANIAFVFGAIMISRSQNSSGVASVQDDYDNKALAWDALQANLHRLGWTCAVSVHDGVLAVDAKDKTGSPLAGTVTVRAYHNKYPDRAQTLTLTPDGSGVYAAAFAATQSGKHTFIVTLTRGTDSALYERELFVENTVPAVPAVENPSIK